MTFCRLADYHTVSRLFTCSETDGDSSISLIPTTKLAIQIILVAIVLAICVVHMVTYYRRSTRRTRVVGEIEPTRAGGRNRVRQTKAARPIAGPTRPDLDRVALPATTAFLQGARSSGNSSSGGIETLNALHIPALAHGAAPAYVGPRTAKTVRPIAGPTRAVRVAHPAHVVAFLDGADCGGGSSSDSVEMLDELEIPAITCDTLPAYAGPAEW